MAIRHVVVLMLENRSFDSMLGRLYPASDGFDGLTGAERNIWRRPDRSQLVVPVWNEAGPAARTIPDPDPGELFADIHMQIHGLAPDGTPNPTGPTMGGFVDNYMRQPAAASADPRAVMHHLMPEQVPVLSQLARAFAVSDRWHASAPCQTWPNRFFAHTGTAAGYVNNSPTHFPYTMPTVFNRLESAGQDWRVYFHDMPQAATLSAIWDRALTHFLDYTAHFAHDAAAGKLPAYSFIEPRYFTNTLLGHRPNDQHPPHDVALGEALIAEVCNAVRSGPLWPQTLLIVTHDEHGGLYDHVAPPAATAPDARAPDGFHFDYFGVRVPAVIVSPYVRAGGVLRPPGLVPFDHTTILSTLRDLFGFAPLTARDAAAPSLLPLLGPSPDNNGPDRITPPAPAPAPAQAMANAAARPPNGMQTALGIAAAQLPTAGSDLALHTQRLADVPDVVPSHATVADAAAAVAAHVKAFLGLA